jgi:hypothetical protein
MIALANVAARRSTATKKKKKITNAIVSAIERRYIVCVKRVYWRWFLVLAGKLMLQEDLQAIFSDAPIGRRLFPSGAILFLMP